MHALNINKPNGNIIPCLANIPQDCDTIVIAIHGLNSHKASDFHTSLLHYLPKRNIGVICYDQPAHGQAQGEELCISTCLDSLANIENHILSTYPKAKIAYLGSSFGAYVLGVYLAKYQHAGRVAFMRSGAMIFPEMMIGDVHAEPDPQAIALLNRQGYIESMVNGLPMRFSKRFLEELRENSLLDLYANQQPKTPIGFVHGDKDAVVPMQAVQGFAQKRGYPFMVIAGGGHSLNESVQIQEQVLELAYQFLKNKG